MKFTVTLVDGSTHVVDAHTFDTQPGLITFYNDTRSPIAAFNGWVMVKTEPKPA